MEDPARYDCIEGTVALTSRLNGHENLIEGRQLKGLGQAVKLRFVDISEAGVGELDTVLHVEEDNCLA